jgi:hypothetical protein
MCWQVKCFPALLMTVDNWLWMRCAHVADAAWRARKQGRQWPRFHHTPDRTPIGPPIWPSDWQRAGKTGNGKQQSNDVVMLTRPDNRPPLFVAGFCFNPAVDGNARRATLAEIGKAVAAKFG